MKMKKKAMAIPVKKNDPKRFAVLGLFLLTVLLSLAISFFAGKDEAYQSVLVSKGEEQLKAQPLPPVESPFRKHKPESIKALYATMYTVGNAKRLDALMDTAKSAGANVLVVDLKGSQGELIF